MKTDTQKNIEFINLMIREARKIKDYEHVKTLKKVKKMVIEYALSSDLVKENEN